MAGLGLVYLVTILCVYEGGWVNEYASRYVAFGDGGKRATFWSQFSPSAMQESPILHPAVSQTPDTAP